MESTDSKLLGTVSKADSKTDQVQFHFDDADAGFEIHFPPASGHGFSRSSLPDLGLDTFLSRPVLIDSLDWVEGNLLRKTIDPWTLYLTNNIIKKKLDNYYLLRMNLHIKVVISASPFYYSLGIVSYNPRQNDHTDINGVVGQDYALVGRSQRPNILITPQNSMGGEMVLPFFLPTNWLKNQVGEIDNMGRLAYDSFSVLRNANGIAGGNVTILTYAWAENVEVSAPTSVLQSGRGKLAYKKNKKSNKSKAMDKFVNFSTAADEYGDGPLSSVASAVARAGNALKEVPIIGPFARATEIGAGAMSRIAGFFGFTNVPVIVNAQPFKDLPYPGFCSSEISGPTPNLTLDPKNELTLDSRTVGLDGTDELALATYVARESYLVSFEWSDIISPGQPLFESFVSPANMYRTYSIDSLLYHTPLSHAAHLYSMWSGSMVFRFKVACTKYHRGRIKITYEPSNGVPGTISTNDTSNITRLYDISADDDIEICVPYMQAPAYLFNRVASDSIADTPVAFGIPALSTIPTNLSQHNGYIRVEVANELTSPSASAPVTISVFVKAGEDFELLGPRTPTENWTWAIQSGESSTNPIAAPMCDMMGDSSLDMDDVNLVYGGETALSLRQLLHRHCFVVKDAFTGVGNTVRSGIQSHYPLSPKYINSNQNIHDIGNGTRYNFVRQSFVSYLSPCFAGRRGSMYWAAQVHASADWSMNVSRLPFISDQTITPDSYVTPLVAVPQTPAIGAYGAMLNNTGTTADGAALYDSRTQSGATFMVPYISNQRMSGTFPSPYISGIGSRPQARNMGFKYEIELNDVEGAPESIDWYCASGPDFNLFFFSGVPTMRVGGPPSPAPP